MSWVLSTSCFFIVSAVAMASQDDADSMLQGYRREGDIQDEWIHREEFQQRFQREDGLLSFFVHGAGDEKANGIYKGITEGRGKGIFFKDGRIGGGTYIRRDTFGAGWCCPDNTVLWWIMYDSSVSDSSFTYFSCQYIEGHLLPPAEGWQIRPTLNIPNKSLPNIAQRILTVSGAGDETVNGDFFDIDGEVTNDLVVIKKESWGGVGGLGDVIGGGGVVVDGGGVVVVVAGLAQFCPYNTLVWWIIHGGDHMYFSCMAQEATLPPMNGWMARTGGLDLRLLGGSTRRAHLNSLQAPVLAYKDATEAAEKAAKAARDAAEKAAKAAEEQAKNVKDASEASPTTTTTTKKPEGSLPTPIHYVYGGDDGSCRAGYLRVPRQECQSLGDAGVVIDGKTVNKWSSSHGCDRTSTPGTGCWINAHRNVRSTADGCSRAGGKKGRHFAVCKSR